MVTINDAEPGDIYTDATGKLWRIISVCREPTVEAEEVEGTLYDPNVPRTTLLEAGQGIVQQAYNPMIARASINKVRQAKPTGHPWWQGWTRIWRKGDVA